eukprot:CAMPEP_0176407866 /NCGR_PEP_ID=MMETSP0127-20121128/1638_1 /TAXON_ID=938130 /ORGANISM="Platyophrya macrostoma, Strain WH" /LENGTH=393 /DNA_ID=CAMNT_0017787097 /DNA_START=224 /DNA_END=1405 /DNA_ORIENTATION=+
MQQPIHRSFATEKVTALEVSPCGTFIVGGGGDTGVLFIWTVLTGELLRLVKGHLRKVTCLSFSSEGSQFASASEDSTCKVWSLATLTVTACAFLHTFRSVATVSTDRNIKIFHAASGTQLLSVTVDVPLTSVSVSCDDSMIVAGGQQGWLFFLSLVNDAKSAKVDSVSFPITMDDSWMPEVRKRPPVEGGHAKHIISIHFLPFPKQHHVVVTSENGAAFVWDCHCVRVVQELPRFKKGICSAVLVSALKPEAIPTMTYDSCVPLAKYPVDPHGQTGYTIPATSHFSIGAPTSASHSPSIEQASAKTGLVVDSDGVPLSLPNVKYNKSKQKRLREELQRINDETEQKRKTEEAHLQRLRDEISQYTATATKFIETANKLQEKIQALEARTERSS